MSSSSEIQAAVLAKVKECLAKAEARYGQTFAIPKIDYYHTGTCAGRAWQNEWRIELHAGLLKSTETRDEMINITVPHEVAHLITGRVYPEVNQRGAMTVTSRGRLRRGKRESHGPRWKSVMAVFGVDDSRCHDMDTTAFARPKDKYDYRCVKCSTNYTVGPKIHNQLVRNSASRWCKCRGGLELVQALGKVTYTQAKEVRAGNASAAVQQKVAIATAAVYAKKTALPIPMGDSKMAKCYRMYEKYNRTHSRTVIIDFFVGSAGCTAAGASTYYASCKKIFESQ